MDRWELIDQIAMDGVITAAQAMAAGIGRNDIVSMCRSGRWRRLCRGTYLIRAADDERPARIRAAVLAAGPGACAVLDTAAQLHGIAGLRRDDLIHVCVPPGARHQTRPDVVIHQLVLDPQSVTTVDGIPTTTPLRTVADLLLRLPRYHAICLLDSALNRKLITEEEFAHLPDLLRHRPGAVKARSRLTAVDGRARSPLETRVRLRCADGGVPPDQCGYLVRDELGNIFAEADMAWLRPKVIAEADGVAVHSLPEAVFTDRHRQNLLANAGWLVLRFTWADTLRPGYIPDAVRQALNSRR
ncbi:MAG TPA: type IV toxin-antitoxin system AbiEi family antitoxin domain-containing protein [Candidatus Limnocylindria bacterium]|nr:type IV toxin-antitoxin system AbiEi family antitoxin domain-containing protein [Candidatus Limnocylindria bacterium]